jgi:hypothetical protein
MQVFISHNSANKADARLLATSLVEQGVGVWLDEWRLRPGESITAGIESGLDSSNVFALIWSEAAARSNWVGTEVRAYLRRRVNDNSLRIVPIMCDDNALPTLVADYRGFTIKAPNDFKAIATAIAGTHSDHDVALILQQRLWELAKDKIPDGSPHKYVICPQCASKNIEHRAFFDGYKERMTYSVMCLEPGCKFMVVQFGDES